MAMVLCAGVVKLRTEFPPHGQSLDAWLDRSEPIGGYPCGAARFVDTHLTPTTGRLINEFGWGGYLEWRLGEHYQTLLDGRTQCFSAEFWRNTYLGDRGQQEAFFSTVSADAAILPSRDSKFEDILIRQGWQVAYRDDRALVLTFARHIAR